MDIDLILVGLFLLVILVVGMRSGRGIKTFEEYAVGNKNFGTWTLRASLIATIYGSSTLSRILELTYKGEIYTVIEPLRAFTGLLIVSCILAIRMGEFMGHLSIAESMGSMYGKSVRIITAVAGIMKAIGTVGAQFYVLAAVFGTFIPSLERKVLMTIIATFVIAYTTFGGARSITITDIIQLLVFVLILFTIAGYMLCNINTPLSAIKPLAEKLNGSLEKVIGDSPPIISTSALLVLLIPSLGPSSTQRIYMSKHTSQIKKVFLYATGLGTIIKILIVVLGVCLFINNSHLDAKKLLEYVISNGHLESLKPFLYMGIIGLAMSTADSDLHVSTVLLTHDIIEPIRKGKIKNKVLVARTFTVMIGLLAVLVAFNLSDLLKVLLNSYNFYIPIVTVPFLMSILGFRPNKRAVLLGMCAGVIAAMVAKFYVTNSFYSIPPPFFANLVTLIATHYLFLKTPDTGWVGIKDKRPLLADRQARARRWRKRKATFQNFSLSVYIKRLFPEKKTTLGKVGFYTALVIFLSLLFIKDFSYGSYFIPFMVLATLFMYYPAWCATDATKRNVVVQWLWPISLFCLLLLPATMCLSITTYHLFTTMLYAANIWVACYLLPFKVVVPMALIAFCITDFIFPLPSLALLLTVWGAGYEHLLLIGIYAIPIWYVIKNTKREKLSIAQLQQAQYLLDLEELKNIQEVNQLAHYDQALRKNSLDKKTMVHMYKQANKLLTETNLTQEAKLNLIDQLGRAINYTASFKEINFLASMHLPLSLSQINIQEFIDAQIDKFDTIGIDLQPVVYNHTQRTLLEGDEKQLGLLFMYSMQFAKETASSASFVNIYLQDTYLQYKIGPKPNDIKIMEALSLVITTAEKAPYIATSYHDSRDIIPPIQPINNIKELHKKELDRIVGAHYAVFTMEEIGTMHYILPLQLSKIKDKVMDDIGNPDGLVLETEASLQQEEDLTKKLRATTTLPADFIQETIQFVKKCHGHQKRQSGEPFYTHPMAVTALLLEETNDPVALTAALLHDVVEDTPITLSYISARFGHEVADIVSKVTNMGHTFPKKKLSKEESGVILRNCKGGDIRPIQVKIADRLHNVLTLHHRPLEKQIKVAVETLEFLVPLAQSVGMQLVARLEAKCQDILNRQKN